MSALNNEPFCIQKHAYGGVGCEALLKANAEIAAKDFLLVATKQTAADFERRLRELEGIVKDLIETMDRLGYASTAPPANEAWRRLREAIQ